MQWLMFLLVAQEVAVKFQQEPLLVPASTVWKTVGGIIASLGLVLWRLGVFIWKKHKEDILAIRTDISNMDTKIRSEINELEDVQDAIIKTTVNVSDYQENRREIRDSIHDLHIKVDGHHQEQMKALIALIKGKHASD